MKQIDEHLDETGAVAVEMEIAPAAVVDHVGSTAGIEPHQAHRLVDSLTEGETARGGAVGGGAGTAVNDHRLHDAADALHLVTDELKALSHIVIGLLCLQILCHRCDGGQRVPDLVGDAGGELADEGQALVVLELGLERGPLGQVLDEDHQAGGDVAERSGEVRLAQVEAAVFAVGATRGELAGADRVAGEGVDDGAPRRRNAVDPLAGDGVVGNAGDLGQRPVPQHDVLVGADRADAHRQVLEHVAEVAAHLVELGGDVVPGVGRDQELGLEGADLLAHRSCTVVDAEAGLDDTLGGERAEEAGEVALELVAQAAELGRPRLVGGDLGVGEGARHLAGGGVEPQDGHQRAGKVVGRSGVEAAAGEGLAGVDADAGACLLLGGRFEAQAEPGHHQRVEPERDEGGEGERIDRRHAEQGRKVEEGRRVVGAHQQRGDGEHEPGDDAEAQAGDDGAPVGPPPEQDAGEPGEELRDRHERDQAELDEALDLADEQEQPVGPGQDH